MKKILRAIGYMPMLPKIKKSCIIDLLEACILYHVRIVSVPRITAVPAQILNDEP